MITKHIFFSKPKLFAQDSNNKYNTTLQCRCFDSSQFNNPVRHNQNKKNPVHKRARQNKRREQNSRRKGQNPLDGAPNEVVYEVVVLDLQPATSHARRGVTRWAINGNSYRTFDANRLLHIRPEHLVGTYFVHELEFLE